MTSLRKCSTEVPGRSTTKKGNGQGKMAKFKPPKELDFTKPENWQPWRQRFERYSIASKLSAEEGTIQVNTLLYAMGAESETIFQSFALSAEDSKVIKTVLEKFDSYFEPKRNVIHERAMFYERSQKEGESVEAYIRTLHEMATHCEFTKKEEQIRDRLVVGLRDKEVSQELQLKGNDLTLDQACTLARNTESVKRQLAEQHPRAVAEVRRSSRGRGRGRGHASRGRGRGSHQSQSQSSHSSSQRQRPAAQSSSSSTEEILCRYCNRRHVADRNFCMAKNAKCHKCNQRGHYAKCCPQNRQVREVVVPDEYGDYDDDENCDYFLGSVSSGSDRPWELELCVGGRSVRFKLDSGADVCVLSDVAYRCMSNIPKLQKCNINLKSVSGKLECLGTFSTKVLYKNIRYLLTFYVVAGATNNLLSRAACSAMKLLQVHLDETVRDDTVFGDLGKMNCAPVKIRLKPDAVPYSLHTARRIPIPLMEKVKAELNRMEREGVIKKITEATEWCAAMVPVIKKNGSVRICVDLKQLNKAVVRERYVLPSLDDLLPKLAGAQVFTSLDCSSGFWAIPLDPEAAKLTTFITPFGRYHFQRLPFGISSAPEIFQRVMADLLTEQEGTVLYMDDILVYGVSKEQHDERLKRVLETIRLAGLKLNKAKCEFAKSSLDFLGHRVSGTGVQPAPSKVDAVVKMKPPQNVSELKSVLGLFNYLCRYVPNLSSVLSPMSSLLRSSSVWSWGKPQDDAFKKAKDFIVRSPTLSYYDPTKPTIVSADASSYGLGACLLQLHGEDRKPIAFASRTLTDAEKKYAQIEKECLASVWACERFAQYLSGLQTFTLETDHKPLVPLMMTRDIDQVPIRCQRLLLRMLRFNPEVIHVPGKSLVIADSLSRRPLPHSVEDVELAQEVVAYVENVERGTFSPGKLEQVRSATDNDDELQVVMDYVLSGWPQYIRDVPQQLRKFFEIRHHLSISERLLLYDSRIYVPSALRADILSRIHQGHQGISKCLERARGSVYWLGISAQIQNVVQSCSFCQEHQRTQRKEPLMPTPIPERPWQRVAADLCDDDGVIYMVVVDYYSRYIELCKLARITTSDIVRELKCIFARFGIPEIFQSDNGPQFASAEFAKFAKEFDFVHSTSSPHFPQSNGEVERAVQTAKSLLSQSDPEIALMVYRSTPVTSTGFSPSQLLMGRQIRTTLPTIARNLQPGWPDQKAVQVNDDYAKTLHKQYYDRRHGVKLLSPLSSGQRVVTKLDSQKTWTGQSTVSTHADTPRSLIINNDQTSRSVRRNRRHLMPVDPPASLSNPVCERPIVANSPSPSPSPTAVTTSPLGRPPDPRKTVTQSGRISRPVQRLDL